jgi:hypothetical protein
VITCGNEILFFDAIRQAALDDESTTYCRKNAAQLFKVSGDSNAWKTPGIGYPKPQVNPCKRKHHKITRESKRKHHIPTGFGKQSYMI